MILSIIVHGKATVFSSLIYSIKSLSTKPSFFHSSAIVSTDSRSFAPFFEQLSIDTSAIGYFPALYLSRSMATNTAIAPVAFLGPFLMSASTNGNHVPSAF